MDYQTFNKLTFGLCIMFAFVLFYQSWMNIVKKQFTKFSMDALMLAYLKTRRGQKSVDRAKKMFITEPNRLRSLGIFALISGILLVYLSIDSYIKYLH